VPRAIWKGAISFGLVSIPVGVFSAVEREQLAFHLLDGRDLSPVRNRRVNERTGEEVPWESIVKGYQLEDGRWVTLDDEDFRSANVKASSTIDVLGAVCRDEVEAQFYDTPYFLAPEPVGVKPYALLREALKAAGRVAVAQFVMRTRQRLAVIVPEGDALLLEVVRYPYELRSAEGLDLPSSDLTALAVTEAELQLAEQLVKTIETEWDPSAYRDTYRDDLMALIERKAAGEAIEIEEAPAPSAQVVDIAELLKRSVEEARRAKAASGE